MLVTSSIRKAPATPVCRRSGATSMTMRCVWRTWNRVEGTQCRMSKIKQIISYSISMSWRLSSARKAMPQYLHKSPKSLMRLNLLKQPWARWEGSPAKPSKLGAVKIFLQITGSRSSSSLLSDTIPWWACPPVLRWRLINLCSQLPFREIVREIGNKLWHHRLMMSF